MITNEAVQRLIACDRETLIELMMMAMTRKTGWPVDPDAQAVFEEARTRNANAGIIDIVQIRTKVVR